MASDRKINRRGESRLSRAVVETLERRQMLANSIYAYPGADGHFLYKPLPLGDKVQDYSTAGYKGGTVPIPDVAVPADPRATVAGPSGGDDTTVIQGAIDYVSGLPLDNNGIRGAVLLGPGTYRIDGILNINASGVVLRGSGVQQTLLYATTNTRIDERTIINVNGSNSQSTSNTQNILDKYVPVGAISFTVSNASGFAVGDTVIVHRPSTANWIHDMGMDLLTNPWTPGSKDIDMDRTITHIDGNVITIDAPITQALDLKYTDATEGTNTIYKYTASGRLSNVGIENLGGISQFDPTVTDPSDGPVDENHPWTFVNIDGAINSWARDIQSQFFGYSCVYITNSKYVTVQDCECIDPVSQITGGRRYSFNIDGSQDVLFRNCYTREGRHDYVEGSTVTGPNVFVDDRADNTHADAGPHHRYSTAALWDNVYSGQIAIQDRGNDGTGHGHSGANQVIWNSTGTSNPGLIEQSPIAAQNWLIGGIGIFSDHTATPVGFHTPALIDSLGTNVATRSLYYQQLGERMGYENFALREVRVGDNDGFTAGDAADAVTVDPTWKSSIQTLTGKTGVGFDDVTAGHLVPFTFNYSIDPGTYVVGASLSLGLKSTGGITSADKIYLENGTRSYTFAQLGLTPPTSTEDGVVIDLSKVLAALQDGKLNLAIQGNSAVDWATLNFQTASTTQRSTTTLTPVADAYVQDGTSAGTNFGTATSLQTKLDSVNNDRESYMKFDLSALSGYVMRATIRMVPTSVGYAPDTRGSGIAAMFNQLSFVADDTWTEGGINFNNRPAAGATLDTYLSKLNAPLNFDVTALVQAALSGDKTLSLKLASITQNSAGQINYGSRENADPNLRPQLIIETFANAQTPVADATVRDGSSAATNFGTATDLSTKWDTVLNSGNNRDAYLKFNLSGVATAPAGATVRLVPFSVGAPTVPGVANFVTDDSWTETGITWNNRPTFGGAIATWPVALGTPGKFDVTSLVSSAIAGDKTLSLRIGANAQNSGVNQYAAREWSDPAYRPLLILKNLGPQITSIPNQAGQVNTAVTGQWFGVWDAETSPASLLVSATSSNTTLLPSGNITFGGSGADRAFTLTPAANQTGTTTITITVTDAQGATASTQFTYTCSAPPAGINGDQDSVGEADSFRIVRNGTFVDVYRNGVIALEQDFNSPNPIAINGLAGNDTFLVDYTGGNPIPAAGVALDGGADVDIVSILGGNGADAFSLAAGGVAGTTAQTFAYVNAEELDLNNNGGSDTLAASGGNASVSTGVFNLNVSAGTLSMTSGSALADLTGLTVGSGATFQLFGNSQTIDTLSGAGTVNNNNATPATLTVGAHNGTSVFSGTLADPVGASPLSLIKNGTGKLTLGGSNSYTGISTINAGVIEAATTAAFVGLSGQVRFGGGTLHVTGNSTAAVVLNKFTTSYTGATTANTGTFDVDANVTLTIGGGTTASLQTNGGGAHGGVFSKAGAGTLRILSGNGQLDDPFKLNAGTVSLESATGLGGADTSSNHVDMKTGTTLILKADAATNFLTPISIVDPAASVNVIIDRATAGAGVTHSLNAISSVGAFTLNLSAGANVTSGTAGLSVGSVTLGGTGTFNIAATAAATVTGVVSGAFGVTKDGAGTLNFNSANTYTGTTTVDDGALRISNGAALGTTAGGTTIQGGAFTGRVELVGDITVAEPFTLANRSSGGASALLPHIENISGNNTLAGNIALNSGGSNWTIQSDAGTLTLAGNLTNANTTNTRLLFLRGAGAGVVTGQILQTNVSITQLQKEDAGTWTIAGVDNHTGPTNVNGGTLLYNTDLLGTSAVNVASGALLQLGALGTRVIKTAAVSVTGSGRLDLEDNKLIVTTAGATGSFVAGAYTGVTGLLARGRNSGSGGNWSGGGIVTSMPDATGGILTGLGVAKVSQAKGIADSDTVLFAGQTVHGSDTIVMYTYGGDANLDGKIDISDYGRIDFNIPLGSNGWYNGDFNYDGKIDISDYGIIDFDIGIQGPAFSTGPAVAATPTVARLSTTTSPTILSPTILSPTSKPRAPKRHID